MEGVVLQGISLKFYAKNWLHDNAVITQSFCDGQKAT